MRQLFSDKRYTKEGVRAFYSEKEEEVHLVYPDTLHPPFKSNKLVEDIIDGIRQKRGVWVTWTPYGNDVVDDSANFLEWEEVVL